MTSSASPSSPSRVSPKPARRIVLWVLFGIAGLVVLIIVAMAIFVATFDVNKYKPLAAAWAKQHYSRTLDIQGPLSLTVFPRVGIKVDGASLSERGRADLFAQVESAEFSLEFMPLLQGRAEVSRVSARGVRLAYERDAQGRTNIDDLLTAGKPAEDASQPRSSEDQSPGLSTIDVAAVELHDVQLRVKDSLAKVNGTVELTGFRTGRIAPGVESPLDMKLNLAMVEPEVRGELDFSTRFSYEQAAGQPLKLVLKNTQAGYEGRLAGLPVKFKLGAETLDAAMGVTTPSGNAGLTADLPKISLDLDLGEQAIALTGKTSVAARRVTWDLAGQLRGAGIDGPVSTSGSYAQESGTVQAKLQMAALDVDKMRAAAPAPLPAGSVDKVVVGPDKGDTPVDLSAVRALKGSVDAGIGKLIANRITFSDVRVALKGDGQTLHAQPFSTSVWGGKVQGNAQVQAPLKETTQRIALSAQASGIRVEQALKDLAGRDTVEGAGNLTVNVNTAGRSVNALKSALAGTANVALRDGAVKGFNLAALGRQAKAALQMKTDDVQKAKGTDKTDFSEVTASFDIANGVARNKDLQAKSPYLRVAGEGAIDIGAGTLDYTTFVTVTDTSKGQGGAELAALDGIRLPVHLYGPLDAMQYKVQWSAVASAAAKDALKDKITEKLGAKDSADAKDKLREKAREKLKGLFK
ncbi:AsmA family protein [Variovorax sp. VNK109]|uniref:AsmA family protein n=1 Tax=Variovorax sp. VNK109 TaxID=3400919 RepID=UPI003C0731F4